MTSYDLFMKEARNCGFDDYTKAKMLYDELYRHFDPILCEESSGFIRLTTNEAILASFLLTKFGAKIRRVTYTTRKEIEHNYKLKLL